MCFVWVLQCSNLPCFADLKRKVEKIELALTKMMQKLDKMANEQHVQKRAKGSKSKTRNITDQSDDHALTDFGFLHCVAMLSYKAR